MEKTANYQLPQWVKEDAIKMEDFNAAFGTLDGALKTQSDAIAGKAGGEDLAAVRQEVAAAREANCLVKLAGPIVTTTENGTLNFDLSQVDMTKVAALFFTFCARAHRAAIWKFLSTVHHWGRCAATVGARRRGFYGWCQCQEMFLSCQRWC